MTEDTPAVSVVIPLYNKERHVARAVRSVLGQTFGDFELIIVNDGSTDGSAEKVRAFDDPRIRLLAREHVNSAGGHAARNLGIAEARADLVAFLDADDEWLPDYLQTVVSLVGKFPDAAAWSTTYYRISPDGILDEWQPKLSILEGDRSAGIVDIFPHNSRPFCTDSIVIWKDALVSIGGFPEGVANGGDVDTWYRLAFRHRIACHAKPKVKYYRNAVNRIDERDCVWVGVRPYFNSLREFMREKGGQGEVLEGVVDSIMRQHYSCFKSNLDAGNRTAALRVACDFVRMKGFASQGLAMMLASLPPSWLTRPLLQLRRFIKYRSWGRPETGRIRRIYP
ncbi:MAG: glycosyltransferase family 2 protein [bacterium]